MSMNNDEYKALSEWQQSIDMRMAELEDAYVALLTQHKALSNEHAELIKAHKALAARYQALDQGISNWQASFTQVYKDNQNRSKATLNAWQEQQAQATQNYYINLAHLIQKWLQAH